MSKSMIAWKRRIAILSLGGCSFVFFGGGFLGSDFPSCRQDAQNRDVATLFQTVGNQSIEAFSDGVLDDTTANSDYDLIIRQPATTFLQAVWSNWVFGQTPQDARFVNVAVE